MAQTREYHNLHYKIRTQRGKASTHDCARCDENDVTKPAADWAQIHGTDGTDIWADYLTLCKRCHMRYDLAGVPRSAEARAAISRAKAGKPTHHKTQAEKDKISATLRADPERAGIARRASQIRWARQRGET